ncbi:MAG TPA: choice-of-anchor D domain-containing protein [Anaerolineales bacterium]|nr:choice-of-anchor D domain-containing protein [Anaerolineales bacterium]
MLHKFFSSFKSPQTQNVRQRAHAAFAAVQILALLFSLLQIDVAPVSAAPIATNEPPIAPHSLIAFTQRDFVSVSGYAEAETVTIEIIHSAAYGGGIVTAGPGLIPVDDPSTPEFDGIVEVNHPGGYCWNGVTPDIRPGDKLRVTVDQTNIADQTTVANVAAKRAVQTGPNTVQIHGTAQDANGNPLPADQLEQRLVSPGNLFDFNNRRTLRAVAAPAPADGVLEYDPIGVDNPSGINWTATYDNLLPDDVTRALAAESRIHWLGINPAAGVESTIFEIGAGIAAGPAAPCTAPLEVLPPPPGSELVPPSIPQNLTATTNGTPNTVTLSWDASTDNVGVTAYGIYRNGVAIANVQNADGSAPAPTTYVDYNVPAGTYDYTVDAADEVGNRSAQSAPPANAITIGQIAIGTANEPPADGRAILVFPSRDFISAENYQPDEQVTVQVIRNGFIVSSVDGVFPIDGLVEVNHPGGYCWAGVTPELRAGDIVRTLAFGPESSTVPRSVDQVTVSNVTANKAVQTSPDTVQIYGTAQDADGNPLPIDQLEQRMVASSKDPFNINGRRTLRAPGDGTISYDTVNNPTGTKWTATYTGLDQHDVNLALSVESRVLWLGRDPLAGIEITLFEVGLLDPPGPSPAFCTSPLEAADVTAPSTPSLSATPNGATRTVQLNWSAATDDTAVYGYLVNRDGEPLHYVGAATLSYLDTNVGPGSHVYTVQAFDSASARGAGASIVEQISNGLGQRYGNLSGFSAPVNVTMPDVTAPSVPANLTALAGVDSVVLNWSVSTDDIAVTEYGVYRGGTLIATVTSGTTFTDSGLALGSYSYTVDAADAAGNRSAHTTAVVADIVSSADLEAPSIPTGVTVSVPNVRARDMVISWSASTDNVGVTGYTLYRNGVALITVNGSTLSYADNNRPAGTYSYTVDASDSAGNRSAQSAAATGAVANDPPTAPHSIIPFPARDFVSSDGYLNEGPLVVTLIRNGVEVFHSDPVIPDTITGLAEINHPGVSGACWAISTPDIRPGDIIRVTNAAGVPDQTVVVGVSAERPIQVNANTVIVRGVAVDENGNRLPIGQIESRLIVGTAASFDNGRRLLRADSGGTGDGLLAYDGSTANWTATYTNLSAADVTKALGAESRGLWLGRAPLVGNESTIFENGPGTDGGPSAGFCNTPAEPNRPQASFNPTNVNFGNQSAVPATTSAVRTVTLNNVSTAAMTINKIYLAGANPTDFNITANSCGSSLAAGASCTVSLTFSPAALGTRSASLSFMDNAANTTFQTVPLTGTGTDNSAPGAPGVPNQAIVNGSVISTTNIPLTISWTASATGIVDHYELQRSISNGAYTNVALPAPTATSLVLNVAPGSVNNFRVRACNATNNCSAYATGTSRTLASVQETVKDISYSGTWTNQVLAGSFGGSVRFASTNRDKAQYKFTATSVSLVGTMGPDRGRISISVDGGAAQIIDLYAPVQQTGRVIFSISGLTANRSHQIVVQVLGNRNPLSTGNRADIDGFVTMR